MQIVGFDIGGTKTQAVVLNEDCKIVGNQRLPRPDSPDSAVAQIHDVVTSLAQSSDEPLVAVGIGIAGTVTSAGSLQYSPNLPEFFDFQLKERLREVLDVAVLVDNDATAATWAEHKFGAGRDVDHLIYVALGTGIGTGFILDGHLYRGAHGFSGESGHMVVDRHGATHVSGERGPWEMYASGSGLGSLAKRWASEGRLPAVMNEVIHVSEIRGEYVSRAIAQGDTDSISLMEEFAGEVALGLNNLIYILDPERIVIGGGLVAIGEPLREAVDRAVGASLLGRDFRPRVEVHLAELGSDSAALGAALLAATEAGVNLDLNR